jgi:RHS repeat-associated protein
MNKYTAYGYRQAEVNASAISYNGDYEIDGLFLMGNGYRLYSPSIRRFYSADSMSPGRAGVNPYTYNLGDPINRSDPSGHESLSVGQQIAIGVAAVSILASLATLVLGAGITCGLISSASVVASLATTTLSTAIVEVIGLAAGIASIIAETKGNKDWQLAGEILGYVSFGFAMGPGIAKGVTKAVTKVDNKISKSTASNGGKLALRGRDASKVSDEIIGSEKTFTGTVTGNGSGVNNMGWFSQGDALSLALTSDRNLNGTGDLNDIESSTTWLKNGRVDKLMPSMSMANKQRNAWNRIYSTVYDGEFAHYATAYVKKLKFDEYTLNTPYIEGKAFKNNFDIEDSIMYMDPMNQRMLRSINNHSGQNFVTHNMNGWVIESPTNGHYLPISFFNKLLPENLLGRRGAIF